MTAIFEILGQITTWILTTVAIFIVAMIVIFNVMSNAWGQLAIGVWAFVIIFGASVVFGIFYLGVRFHGIF